MLLFSFACCCCVCLFAAFNCVDTNLNFTLPQRKTLLNCILVWSPAIIVVFPAARLILPLFRFICQHCAECFPFISFHIWFVVFGFPCAFRFHALHYLISSVLNSTRKWKWQYANMCLCVCVIFAINKMWRKTNSLQLLRIVCICLRFFSYLTLCIAPPRTLARIRVHT